MSSSTSALFSPIRVGNLDLQHRVVLAPLTRMGAHADHVPSPQAPVYYSQRGSTPGTLLIAEATFISQNAGGYDNVPGIYTDAHVEGWKKVRLISLNEFTDEIKEYVAKYAAAAKNAIRAGFDGVEIHGANGFLIDQFIQDVTNNRTDEYGGSIENRARFALEVADAVIEAVGAERMGFRISPWGTFSSMGMADPKPQFSYVVEQLRKHKLAYIHVVEPQPDEKTAENDSSFLRDIRESAIQTVDNKGGLIGFGRPFL